MAAELVQHPLGIVGGVTQPHHPERMEQAGRIEGSLGKQASTLAAMRSFRSVLGLRRSGGKGFPQGGQQQRPTPGAARIPLRFHDPSEVAQRAGRRAQLAQIARHSRAGPAAGPSSAPPCSATGSCHGVGNRHARSCISRLRRDASLPGGPSARCGRAAPPRRCRATGRGHQKAGPDAGQDFAQQDLFDHRRSGLPAHDGRCRVDLSAAAGMQSPLPAIQAALGGQPVVGSFPARERSSDRPAAPWTAIKAARCTNSLACME